MFLVFGTAIPGHIIFKKCRYQSLGKQIITTLTITNGLGKLETKEIGKIR